MASTTSVTSCVETLGYITHILNSANNDVAYKEFYLLKDHLGSTDVLVRNNGTVAHRMGFTSWGERRNAASWNEIGLSALTSILGIVDAHAMTKGYTGHEQDDEVGLINMKGRLYDPVLGRFISADPFVQAPEFSQSYNRYSYVVNNPLRYIDPSGYNFEVGYDSNNGDYYDNYSYGVDDYYDSDDSGSDQDDSGSNNNTSYGGGSSGTRSNAGLNDSVGYNSATWSYSYGHSNYWVLDYLIESMHVPGPPSFGLKYDVMPRYRAPYTKNGVLHVESFNTVVSALSIEGSVYLTPYISPNEKSSLSKWIIEQHEQKHIEDYKLAYDYQDFMSKIRSGKSIDVAFFENDYTRGKISLENRAAQHAARIGLNLLSRYEEGSKEAKELTDLIMDQVFYLD